MAVSGRYRCARSIGRDRDFHCVCRQRDTRDHAPAAYVDFSRPLTRNKNSDVTAVGKYRIPEAARNGPQSLPIAYERLGFGFTDQQYRVACIARHGISQFTTRDRPLLGAVGREESIAERPPHTL